jgi:hypothetical protein
MRPAVADLLPLFDIGQSIPQCKQPLAAERSGVQFLLRYDGNLAVSDCRRRAAQRDPVIANNVDAHGCGLRVWTQRPLPPVTHTDALFADQSQSILG